MSETSFARRTVPLLVLPLALVACALAGTPWLRAFPSGVMAVPLIATALLSVLLPVVAVAVGVRWLWFTALLDVAGFVFFTTLIALRDPLAVASLWDGLVHGPAQVLTDALPLVSPRTLLVAPLALLWACGAVIGESVARGWNSLLPYAAALVTYGLSYTATTRAVDDAAVAQRYDLVLAGLLLLTLLLLRAVRAWLRQEDDATAGQSDGVLPLRGLARGAAVSVLVAALAALVAQTVTGPPTAATRTPPIVTADPVSPLSFVAGLRPSNPQQAGRRLFMVTLGRDSSRYVALADVDTYDGDGWTFTRQFSPSGGVVPAPLDPALRAPGDGVSQQYTIAAGPLADAPWLPFQYRPRDVTGVPIAVDPASGMVVPRTHAGAARRYTVVSAPGTDFARLPASATVATSLPPADTYLPFAVRRSIGTVVSALRSETGTKGAPALPFLRALQRDLSGNYALSGGSAAPRTGGTGFAGVLASILGTSRAATPEQYATLVAIVARAEGVPARVVTGFRLDSGAAGAHVARAGQAWTWVEIPVAGRGWTVLDAAPARYSGRTPQPTTTVRPSPSPTPSPSNALITQAPAKSGNAVAPSSPVPGSRTPASTMWLVAAAVVLLALVVMLALLWRKRRRVLARRRGDPRRQVIGAWQETLDVLAESGLAGLDSLTSTEVATRAGQRYGAETALRTGAIGAAADRAIFQPSATVDAGAAAAAWQGQREVRQRIRRVQTRRQRISAGLRYSRPRRRSVPRRSLRS